MPSSKTCPSHVWVTQGTFTYYNYGAEGGRKMARVLRCKLCGLTATYMGAKDGEERRAPDNPAP
jgi:hypothetical protein